MALLFAPLAFTAAPAYTIRTYAGGDSVGDGGPAAKAFVSILEGVCADAAGNIYVADADDNRIRKIDTAGNVTTYAGTGYAGFGGDGGPANQAALSSPFGIRMDANGNLFIADLGNNRVRKVSAGGTISTFASGLNQPRNVAFGAGGALYVSEFGANRVVKINADGSTTVIAGSGASGFGGDGGPASSALLNGPAGLAFDSAGSLYIADSSNECIRKVTADGTISTFLGGVPVITGTNFPLIVPTGLASDSADNLYVASAGSPATFRIDASGTRHVLPGIGRDIFPSVTGDILLVGQQHLEELHADGSVTTVFSSSAYTFGDGGPAIGAHFESIGGLAADALGNVVLADSKFRRLRQVASDGTIESLQTSDYLSDPGALAFDPNNVLYVADTGSILIAEPTGPPTVFTSGLSAPAGLTFTTQPRLYFTDTNQAYSTDASGTPAALPLLQSLNAPTGIAAASDGSFYVADTGNNVIRKIAADGSDSAIAGNGAPGFFGDEGPAAQAQLSAPAGIAVDRAGNIWIADTGNQRIRFIDSSGIIHTVAGTGSAGFSGDGGAAQQAQISSPTAIACDPQGDVFFVDSGNRRVRELTAGAATSQSTTAAAGTLAITQAATFLTGPIVGGEIVSLFGTGLGPATALAATLDASGKVATTLGDTQVLVNGVPAPLYYVQANQINAQIPIETSGHLSVLVEVQRSGVTQSSVVSDVAPYSPGLFAVNGTAAALNFPDYSLNGTAHPAAAGSVILLFGTGFGDTSPLSVTGLPAIAPFGIPLAPVSVFIGGTAAQVLYVGDAPGFAGLTQINAVIPPGTPSGKVQIQVSASDVVSPTGIDIQVR
jgi:uncharacterized protein (TIGR03437 family)